VDGLIRLVAAVIAGLLFLLFLLWVFSEDDHWGN
jgi:hypothetical protein